MFSCSLKTANRSDQVGWRAKGGASDLAERGIPKLEMRKEAGVWEARLTNVVEGFSLPLFEGKEVGAEWMVVRKKLKPRAELLVE